MLQVGDKVTCINELSGRSYTAIIVERVGEIIYKVNQIFSETDPYGEENW